MVAAKRWSEGSVCRCCHACSAFGLSWPPNSPVAVWYSPAAWISSCLESAGPMPSRTKIAPSIS